MVVSISLFHLFNIYSLGGCFHCLFPQRDQPKHCPWHKRVPSHRGPSSSQDGPMRPPMHLMFLHTAKGQEYNMPLLACFISPSWASDQTKQHFPCLIDYELLTDKNGKRTAGFWWFAGVAGVLESLAAMAQHHLEMGIVSPFLVCLFFLYQFVPLAYSSPAHPSPIYPTYHQKTP